MTLMKKPQIDLLRDERGLKVDAMQRESICREGRCN